MLCATVVLPNTSWNNKQGQSDDKNARGEIEANMPITFHFQNEGNSCPHRHHKYLGRKSGQEQRGNFEV